MAVEVKICGLTHAGDAAAALDAGADYLGFVFYSGSSRAVTADEAARVIGELGRPCRAVGVFVNAGRAEVERIAQRCGLYAVQLHGDESSDEFRDMDRPVWRALTVSAETCRPAPENWPAARYVVDAAVPGRRGGTGVPADWRHAARLAARFPVLLAGGLTPDNVAAAVAAVRPLGVDVSSGVEQAPGRKDVARMRRFIEETKRERES